VTSLVLCSFIVWSYEFGIVCVCACGVVCVCVCVCFVRTVQPDIASQELRENLKLSLLFVHTRIAHS